MVCLYNLNPEKVKVLQRVTDNLTHVYKHNTVILSYVPMCTLPCDTLQLVYSNVCSVKAKIQDIPTDKNLKYSDILYLSETWLQNTYYISEYTLQNYTTICTDVLQYNVPSTAHHGLLRYVQKLYIIEIHKYPGITSEAIKVHL